MKDHSVGRVCFLTVTFAPDVERFALLRRSCALFAPAIPHLAIVDTEDLGLFRKRFGGEASLTLLPTAELVPPGLERIRKIWRRAGRPFTTRVAWRLGIDAAFRGWKFQQIVKLEAHRIVPCEAVVFLDSDVFLCAPVTHEQFFSDGKLLLLETAAASYEDHAFEIAREALVNRSLAAILAAFNYIHTPPRFLRRTMALTVSHLAATHRDWHSAFLGQAMPSEYSLLGWAVREREAYAGYQRRPGGPAEWSYEIKTPEALAPGFATCRAEGGRRRFVLVQSNMRLTEYLAEARALIEGLAGGAQPA